MIELKGSVDETMCIEKLRILFENIVSSHINDMIKLEEYNCQLALFYVYTANKMNIYEKVVNKYKNLVKDLTGEPSNEIKESFNEYKIINEELTWLTDSIGVLEKKKVNLYSDCELITDTK